MEMKKVLEQQGREARNLVAYHLIGNVPSLDQKMTVKRPPLIPRSQMGKNTQTNGNSKTNGPRVRSASTGRDKKSELQSRYWALLFGNLQNAINEIYQTVECYENLSSCQEAILVLENYIRDFKALAEWFKVSWDYEATPPPQRPQSLAWEVRKSNPTPRIRAKSLTSPALSGKSSPSYSGKNSPCQTIEENSHHSKLQKKNSEVMNDVSSASQVPLIQIKEIPEDSDINQKKTTSSSQTDVEYPGILTNSIDDSHSVSSDLQKIEEIDVLKVDVACQTDLDDDNLTLVEYLEKHSKKPIEIVEENIIKTEIIPIEIHNEVIEQPKCISPKNPELPPVHKKNNANPIKYSNVLNRPSTVTSTSKPLPKAPISSISSSKVSTGSRTQIVTKRGPTPNLVLKSNPVRNTPVRTSVSSNNGKIKTDIKPSANSGRGKKENWVPSNVANRLSARSKTMIDIDPNKSYHFPSRNGLSSKKSSCESSSSTLIASNEKLSRSNSSNFDSKSRKAIENRRSEPKNLPSDSKMNNDGWLTVKTRRRSSLHWANRFNQPTGYASLPTLSLLNENENKEKDKEHKESNEQISDENNQQYIKLSKNTKSNEKSLRDRKINSAPLSGRTQMRDDIVLRQKSDLTGLKLKALRKEYLKSEQSKKPDESNKHNLVNLKTVQTQLVVDDDIEKVDMNIQTNSMFSQTINDLYSMCHQCDDDENKNNLTVENEINHALSSCDELEERDAENDEDQRKLLEEQESLERQIRELENAEIDVDTETDETDCEVTIDLEDSIADSEIAEDEEILEPDENISLEMRYQSFLSDMSIVERDATLATLQALVARHPGRAQELHQKLSSPSRRRSLHETLKKYQAKQARAQEKRERLQKEKAMKIQHLLTRVEDVKAAKQHLIEEKRHRMEERLQRAAENRSQYLKDKIRKAHDEEEKLREIAFIKNLEAQNKRLDLLESSKETEVRLQDLEQERQKKVEEKAAKEAAVERRRLELEKERLIKLEKMRETRREREKRIGKMQEQKEKERQAMAREKARGREERLQAKQAQEMATTQELQRKIIQKQQESARRHEENIEHIRQRALELSIPTRVTDENGQRVLSADRGEVVSDLSSTVSDVSREFSKASKKKLKKLKQRMSTKAEEYISELQELPVHIRKDSQVPKLLNTINKGGGPQGMERPIGQLLRLVAKAQINDFQCMWLLNGLETLTNVIKQGMDNDPDISKRAVLLAVQLYRNSCSFCPQIARHAVLGNTVSTLVDCLLISLQSPEEKTPLHPVELSTELILACTVVLSPTNSLKSHPKVTERLPDIISYCVSIGLVDILTLRCNKIREPIENHQSVVLSILATLSLLTKLAEICPKGVDSTKFLSTIKNTELFGAVTLLYSTIVPIGECLPPRTISVAAAILNLLVTLATLDISTFQDVLTDEMTSLKLLDVASILLQYCGPKSSEKGETQAVIVDLIATLGFFCANRRSNQNLLTSEQSSTIIKSLTKLPKEFNIVIYPALVTIFHDNEDAKKVLSKDFDVESLEEYKKSELAKKNTLVSLLKS